MTQRIDKWVAENYGELSRSYVQNLLAEGLITVNGLTVKPSYQVEDGDQVEVRVPEPELPEICAENIPLDIVYEDADVILINKPKGMVVHPAPGHYSGTMVNALLYHCGDSLSGINGILRPGIVHRIDKDTTGIVIACKNDRAHESLSAQLKEHTITRKYFAIVHGVIHDPEGTIRGAIARHPADRKKMAIDERRGRAAVTHYRVLQCFRNFTYVECVLETGRTHQIRVHMKSIQHPVLGDPVYGPARCPYSLQGQTLHAGVLGFRHPTTGEYMEFQSPLPDYFQRLLETIPQ